MGEAVDRRMVLGFSVDSAPARYDACGYRAKPHTGVIDLDKLGV